MVGMAGRGQLVTNPNRTGRARLDAEGLRSLVERALRMA